MITAVIIRLHSLLIQEEEGVSAVEYAILAAMLVVGLVAAVPQLTGGISAAFLNIAGQLIPA